jgi:hypothetical protein
MRDCQLFAIIKNSLDDLQFPERRYEEPWRLLSMHRRTVWIDQSARQALASRDALTLHAVFWLPGLSAIHRAHHERLAAWLIIDD